MTTTMMMSSTTPAMTVRPGDVKIAPMLGFPLILLRGLANPQSAYCSLAYAPRSTVAEKRYPPMTNAWRAPEASHALRARRGAPRPTATASSARCSRRSRQRRDLLALLAFDHELARTRSVTREPMLARIRLEWWREAVAEAAGSGKPRAQPIVESLSETVRRHGLAPQRLLGLDRRARGGDRRPARRAARGPCAGRPAACGARRRRRADRGRPRAPVAAAWLMGDGARARRPARRGARAASRRQSRGAAHPAAGALARRHERLAQAARLLVGGRRAIRCPRIDKSWVVSTASKMPSTIAASIFSVARRQLRFENFAGMSRMPAGRRFVLSARLCLTDAA